MAFEDIPSLGGNYSSNISVTLMHNPPLVRQLMSDAMHNFLFLVFFYATIPISLFGVLTNTVNVIVFSRLGFGSVSNITLFCLAASDLLSVSFIAVTGFSSHPAFRNIEFFMTFPDFIMTIMPIFYCNQAVGSWITTIICVERCFCVMFPMKVKMWFTRKTLFWLLIGMILFQLCSSPRYASFVMVATISPRTNSTLYVIDRSKYDQKLALLLLFITSSLPTLICFIVVTLATIFLVIKFKQSRQVRRNMSGTKEGTISTKDAILIRCVISISIVYIFGYFPTVAYFVFTMVDPTFHMYDPYKGNFSRTLMTVGYLSQTMSCSVNIIFYMSMSTQFKKTFKGIFLC